MKTLVILLALTLVLSVPASTQTSWTKAEMDSIQKMLVGVSDDSVVNMEKLRLAMEYMYNKTLRDGHKQYVSMPAYAKNGLATRATARADSLERNLHRLNVDVSQVHAGVTQEVTGQLGGLRNRLNEHEERISDQEDIELARYEEEEEEEDEDSLKVVIERFRDRLYQRMHAKKQEELKETPAAAKAESDDLDPRRRIRVGVRKR